MEIIIELICFKEFRQVVPNQFVPNNNRSEKKRLSKQ
jgi:hypothetical protein